VEPVVEDIEEREQLSFRVVGATARRSAFPPKRLQ
jgi:hypothetical protein